MVVKKKRPAVGGRDTQSSDSSPPSFERRRDLFCVDRLESPYCSDASMDQVDAARNIRLTAAAVGK